MNIEVKMKKILLFLFAVWLLISFQVANAQAPAGCVVFGTTYDFNVPVTTKLNFKVLEVKKSGLLVRQFKNRKFGFTTATGVTSTILPQGSTARIKGDVAGFDGTVFFAIPSTDSVALTDLQPANVSVQSQGGYVQIKEIDNSPTKTIQGLNDTLVVDLPITLRKGTLADTLGIELSKLTNTAITTSDSTIYWNTAAAAWRKSDPDFESKLARPPPRFEAVLVSPAPDGKSPISILVMTPAICASKVSPLAGEPLVGPVRKLFLSESAKSALSISPPPISTTIDFLQAAAAVFQ